MKVVYSSIKPCNTSLENEFKPKNHTFLMIVQVVLHITETDNMVYNFFSNPDWVAGDRHSFKQCVDLQRNTAGNLRFYLLIYKPPCYQTHLIDTNKCK